MKKTYWKVVSEEYPEGEVYTDKESALRNSFERRSSGEKAYVRAVKMTEEEIQELTEL